MARKYITAGSVNIDNVVPYGAESKPGIRLGGGVMYAAQGLRLWENSIAVAAYSGQDFEQWYGPWLSENGIDGSGVVKKYSKTRQANLVYNKDGTFNMDNRIDLERLLFPSVIDPFLLEPLIGSETVAAHVLADPVPEVVVPLSKLFKSRGIRFGMEFEVAKLYGKSGNHELLKEMASYTDYCSFSYYEAQHLFPDIRDVQDALEELQSYEVPCYFRLGTDGAYYIEKNQTIHVPMIDRFGSVDATGCGNSSTSSVFWALCNGYEAIECAYIGAVTASLNAGYEGLIPHITPEMREQCASMVKEYLQQIRQ